MSAKSRYITVAGRFHYHNYIDDILSAREDYKFIYSHKYEEGDSDNKTNLFLKEYLVRAHIMIFGSKFRDKFFPIYHKLWEVQLTNNIIDPVLWHFMLHGNNPNLVGVYSGKKNTVLLGEAVNTHPLHYINVINKERLFRGLRPIELSVQDKKILQEISLIENVLCPSSYVKKTYEEHVNDGRYNFYVKNFSANLSRFFKKDNKKSSGKFKIGFVGQLILRKGVLYLLEAFSKIKSKNIEIHIVGLLSDELKELIKPYWSEVVYYERIDNASLNDFYNEIDVFVLPTLEEGLALVLCEAIAAGVPVITTEESGILDICSDRESVHIIESSSVDALSEALLYMMSDKEYSDFLSNNALARIKEVATWSQYANGIVEIHDKLLE